MKIKLIINFIAGSKKAKSYLPRIKSAIGGLGLKNELSVIPTGKIEETIEFSSKAVKDGFDLVIAAGGDGTLNAVINGVMKAKSQSKEPIDVPIGFIPLGTTNVFALETGIPLDPIKACKVIINHKVKKADLVKIAYPKPRYFISMAGIGFDAKVVKALNPVIKDLVGGKMAHVVSLIQTLTKYHPEQFSITDNHDKSKHSGYFAIIGNIKSYGGKFRVTPHANLDDGFMDVCLFQSPHRRDILRYLWGILTQQHLRFKDVEYFKAKKINVSGISKLWLQIDGESLEKSPSEFEICPKAVTMILP
jgi:diacylglycerol kinase (ATP)